MDCDSRINECYYDPLSSICNEGTKLVYIYYLIKYRYLI